LDQAELIFFYLTGYSGNERSPVNYGNDPQTNQTGLIGETDRESLFDFDPTRLYDHDNDGIPWYIPKGAPLQIPYVYFHKRKDDNTNTYKWQPDLQAVTLQDGDSDFGQAKPTFWVDETVGAEASSRRGKDFQIICAGIESKYDPLTDLTSRKDGTEDDE
jgi:hypothetical protein